MIVVTVIFEPKVGMVWKWLHIRMYTYLKHDTRKYGESQKKLFVAVSNI